MEIHELNTFSGTLGSGDYFATDNGNDTSKVSAESMFAPLNARIDNTIADLATSAEEIIDARVGADGTVYSSLGNAIRAKSPLTNIANAWGSSTTYTKNQFVVHNGDLYRCNVDTSTTGSWVDSEWTRVTIGGRLYALQNEVAAKSPLTNIANAWGSTGWYTTGQYVIHDGDLYRCNVERSTVGSWVDSEWSRVTIGARLYVLQNEMADLFINSGEVWEV